MYTVFSLSIWKKQEEKTKCLDQNCNKMTFIQQVYVPHLSAARNQNSCRAELAQL